MSFGPDSFGLLRSWFGVICTFFGDNRCFWCHFGVTCSKIILYDFIHVWIGRSAFDLVWPGLVWFGVIW